MLVNDRRVDACLALAIAHDGDRIQTIEGLANAAGLHPVQAAFIEHDGFQCGYCTPGQICSAVAMLAEARQDTVSAVTADVRRRGPVALSDAAGHLQRAIGAIERLADHLRGFVHHPRAASRTARVTARCASVTLNSAAQLRRE